MKRFIWIGALLATAIIVAACAPAATPETIRETVVVEQEGETVVVTATAELMDAGADTGTVFVMGAVRGTEATAFEAVIAAFEEANPDIDVIYSGSGEFETLITVRVEAGDPPDVAYFPQPGAVAKLAREGQLVPLWDGALAVYDAEYTPAWKELSSVDGVPYGMFHRVNAKGWVWYDKAAFGAAGYEVPTTWDELMALTEEMKASGTAPWCEGIESGAATGWKITDWVENVVMRTQPLDVHDGWVTGDIGFSDDRIKGAWEILGDILLDPEAVFGGAPFIAVTNFQEPAKGVFKDPAECWLHMQGSFVTNFFQQEVQDNLDDMVGVFMLPPIDPSVPFTLEVGGDQAVVFNGHDRPEVRKFIEFLGTPAAVEPWATQGGALFPHVNQDVSWYPTDLESTMAAAITTATGARFDSSDNMASATNLAFWKGATDWISGNRTLEEALADIDAAAP